MEFAVSDLVMAFRPMEPADAHPAPRKNDAQTSSVTVTPSSQDNNVTINRYLLTVTLCGNMGFAKPVTVSGVSL